jgi:hypothetical protein
MLNAKFLKSDGFHQQELRVQKVRAVGQHG